MRKELVQAIKSNQAAFDLELSDDSVERLANYYGLVMEHNALLHLVAPCLAEEFAIRHILESLTLLEYLPAGAKFADVGSGAGLPSIPCLLVREDLKAMLIESKEKKANFLQIAVNELAISRQAEIAARQFQEVDPADCEFVTCRALDKFTEKLAPLLRWSRKRKILFFGGEKLRETLESQNVTFAQKLTPLSERRFLFIGR